MQRIVDACLEAEAERLQADQRREVRRLLQRNLIAELESPRNNRDAYPAIAALLERDATAAGMLAKYIDLIWRLGAADVSERIESEVAQALRDVWGLR